LPTVSFQMRAMKLNAVLAAETRPSQIVLPSSVMWCQMPSKKLEKSFQY